jgi:hypothetical protein
MLHLASLRPYLQTLLEGLAKIKYSSLLKTLINYGFKKFYNIGP